MRRTSFLIALIATVGSVLPLHAQADRLYGTVTTVEGDRFEGYLRWDRNEGSWVDILNGSKEIPERNWDEAEDLDLIREGDRDEGRVEILGIRISWDEDGWRPESAELSVRMGHLAALTPLSRDRVLLTFRSGREFEMIGSSTDAGSSFRGVVVEDPRGGEIELGWRDIEEVEFSRAPDATSRWGARLYGTLETRRGETFTGWVTWDRDEIFGEDVLDGEDRDRDRSIPFYRIASIERDGPSGAMVRLRSGEEFRLEDSNDVDDGNRGIAVLDPALGSVEVDWDEFELLTLSAAPSVDLYGFFDGGHRIEGTVETRDGDEFTGALRWDNDEEWSWEILDGESRGVEFDIEFGQIASIERISSRRALVTLHDGRAFELEDSNDVDRDNKGIFLLNSDGEAVRGILWDDLERVRFQRR